MIDDTGVFDASFPGISDALDCLPIRGDTVCGVFVKHASLSLCLGVGLPVSVSLSSLLLLSFSPPFSLHMVM